MGRLKRLVTTARVGLSGLVEAQFPFRTPQAIRRRQARQLRRITSIAFRHVPYYRDLARSTGLRARDFRSVTDLQKLPLVDGRTLQANPTAFVSDAFAPSSLLKLHSTGTAAYGCKTVYWHPRQLLSMTAYGERDRTVLRRLLGQTHGLVRLSFFHPESSTSQASRFKATLLTIPKAMMKTHWASSQSSLDEITELLNRLRPDVAYSYGSFAEAYLLHVLDHGLSPSLPRVWVFGGDGVSPESRERIEEALPCVLHSTYQSVEAGRMGFECEQRNGYHINEDFCHIDLVDEHGDRVAPGETGEVVLSGMLNRASVLLNYKLGDYARWHTEPCPCGRSLPVLDLTGSRTGSHLRLRNGETIQHNLLLHTCKRGMEDVLQYQILEREPESIVWRVVLSRNADSAAISEWLIERTRSLMSSHAEVCVEVIDRIELPDSKKLSRIIRLDTVGPASPDSPTT